MSVIRTEILQIMPLKRIIIYDFCNQMQETHNTCLIFVYETIPNLNWSAQKCTIKHNYTVPDIRIVSIMIKYLYWDIIFRNHSKYSSILLKFWFHFRITYASLRSKVYVVMHFVNIFNVKNQLKQCFDFLSNPTHHNLTISKVLYSTQQPISFNPKHPCYLMELLIISESMSAVTTAGVPVIGWKRM